MRAQTSLILLTIGVAVGCAHAPRVDDAALPAPLPQFQDCDVCPEMVVLQGGEFLGSVMRQDQTAGTGERLRPKSVGSFAVAKFETTFANWDACVADKACAGYAPTDEGWGRGNRPVLNVSRDDALAYTHWLSGKTGREYRLLSADEWEYAARAGSTAPYHFGNEISFRDANYNHADRTSTVNFPPIKNQTAPVGSYPPNHFGLHDMHGNVWEWVSDCGRGPYVAKLSANTAPPARGFLGECKRGVARGGSWLMPPKSLRMDSDLRPELRHRSKDLGFRVAATLK